MLRTLEIGPRSYIRDVYPADTVFVSTGFTAVGDGPRKMDFGLRTLRKVCSMLHDGSFDAVVVHAQIHVPTTLTGLNRILFGRHLIRGHFPLLRATGTLLPGRATPAAPMCMVDFEDHPFLYRHNIPLLARSNVAFKRELPPDYWRLLAFHGTSFLPSSRFRLRSAIGRHLDKVRPLPLGLKLDARHEPIDRPRAKRSDIFFAGLVQGNSWVRTKGLEEVLALRDAGYIVDVPTTRLPPEEFLERCAAAWLVWSPEGLGWDCFRHYETPLAWSVPLINAPTIVRHMPLREGTHAFFYDTAPGGLTTAFKAAIADKDRLKAMAQAGRAHVLAHHTPKAIADYILSTTVSAPPAARPAA